MEDKGYLMCSGRNLYIEKNLEFRARTSCVPVGIVRRKKLGVPVGIVVYVEMDLKDRENT